MAVNMILLTLYSKMLLKSEHTCYVCIAPDVKSLHVYAACDLF